MKNEVDTPRKRRSFARAFKRQVVEETLVAGASVSGVALRHGLNNNMVFKWRREYLRRRAPLRNRPVSTHLTVGWAPQPHRYATAAVRRHG
jgi:transposase